MQYNGVVFDFNGTLYWDTPLHNKAWNIFLQKHGLHFTDEEFFTKIHGKNNKDLLQGFFQGKLSDQEIEQYIAEKEELYQSFCVETKLGLAPGVIDFLNFLKGAQVPFTIATASGKENVDFYFEFLGIDQWFDYDKVVYNNGLIKSKPDPEIYQLAMQTIGVAPDQTIIFEDAIAGLKAAKNAKAGKIIVVNSNNDDYSDWSNYQIITDYNQVNKNLLKK